MAEESKGEEVPKEEETSPPVDEAKKAEDRKNGNKRNFKRDETPIEELFDLSKPIPRVRYHRTIFLLVLPT